MLFRSATKEVRRGDCKENVTENERNLIQINGRKFGKLSKKAEEGVLAGERWKEADGTHI